MVEVTLHGELGKICNKKWHLAVKNAGEAIRAIEFNTKKLYKYLLNKEKQNIKYRVLINGADFLCEKKGTFELNDTDINFIRNSELNMELSNLKTIDIIPILEGNDKIVNVIIGAILVVVGIGLIWNPIGWVLIVAGLGLLAEGIVQLLTKPPQFEDFRQQPNGQISYLFSGPQNTTQEGGPVPIGYGKLLVGSQVISAAYLVEEYDVDTGFTTNNLTTSSLKQTQVTNPGLISSKSNKLSSNLISNNPSSSITTSNYLAIQSGVNPTLLISNNISGSLIDNNVNII